MFKLFQQLILHWLKAPFKGNPIVEDTGPYLIEVAQAFKVGLIALVSLIAVAFLGSIIFMLGVINGWF